MQEERRLLEQAAQEQNIGDFACSTSPSLLADLRYAHAVVACTSNAACQAVIEGVPTFVTDPNCMAWDVANTDMLLLHKPVYPEREAWAFSLAYSQWHVGEFESGECWTHFRPYIKKKKR
mgnify:CR=1 FL=1